MPTPTTAIISEMAMLNRSYGKFPQNIVIDNKLENLSQFCFDYLEALKSTLTHSLNLVFVCKFKLEFALSTSRIYLLCSVSCSYAPPTIISISSTKPNRFATLLNHRRKIYDKEMYSISSWNCESSLKLLEPLKCPLAALFRFFLLKTKLTKSPERRLLTSPTALTSPSLFIDFSATLLACNFRVRFACFAIFIFAALVCVYFFVFAAFLRRLLNANKCKN